MRNIQEEIWWDDRHIEYDTQNKKRFMGHTSYKKYKEFFKLDSFLNTECMALEVGIGTGRATREFVKDVKSLDVLDISLTALKRVADICRRSFQNHIYLEKNMYDLILCFNVFQHIDNVQLTELLKSLIRSIKPNGSILVQYSFSHTKIEPIFIAKKMGCVWRKELDFKDIVESVGGYIKQKTDWDYYKHISFKEDKEFCSLAYSFVSIGVEIKKINHI